MKLPQVYCWCLAAVAPGMYFSLHIIVHKFWCSVQSNNEHFIRNAQNLSQLQIIHVQLAEAPESDGKALSSNQSLSGAMTELVQKCRTNKACTLSWTSLNSVQNSLTCPSVDFMPSTNAHVLVPTTPNATTSNSTLKAAQLFLLRILIKVRGVRSLCLSAAFLPPRVQDIHTPIITGAVSKGVQLIVAQITRQQRMKTGSLYALPCINTQ